jgi:hypothetical protein
VSLFEQLSRMAPKAPAAAQPQPPPSTGEEMLRAMMASTPPLAGDTDHELNRIVAMPIVDPISDAEVDAISARLILAPKYAEGFRFFKAQAWAVREYERTNGRVLGNVTVGEGKTLTSLLIAQLGFERGLRKIILITESQVYPQLVRSDIPWARQRINLTVPFQELGGRSKADRQALAGSGRRGCYLMTYSLLSTEDGQQLLESIEPELVIADEGHKFKNRGSARTRRFLHYAAKHPFQFFPMSGTLTSRALGDYQHLAALALKQNSPLPLSWKVAEDWGLVLDSGAAPTETQARELSPLLEWAQARYPSDNLAPTVEGYRKAFQRRFATAPGVILCGSSIGTSLTFVNLEATVPAEYPGRRKIDQLIHDVEVKGVTPNGDELEHAMLCWKWIEELSAGFYNEQLWPTPDAWMKRRGVSAQQADDELARARGHHEVLQAYHSVLRRWLSTHRRKGLDTPKLVGLSFYRHGNDEIKDVGMFEVWSEARARAWDGMPERYGNSVRVCDYKVRKAVEWAESFGTGEGAILWYWHQDIGRWLVELLKAGPRAADVMWCPAEGTVTGTNAAMIVAAANAGKVMVASIAAHGRGKNLQYLSNMLVAQWPRDPVAAEQLVGRLHRNGQQADHLDVVSLRTTEHDHLSFAACLNDAVYIQQTTGARQKVVYGAYNPMPPVYSDEFLAERMLEPERLTQEQRRVVVDKFGDFQQ